MEGLSSYIYKMEDPANYTLNGIEKFTKRSSSSFEVEDVHHSQLSAPQQPTASAGVHKIEQPFNQSVSLQPMLNPNVDPSKLKRIMANRESAKKSRTRHAQYVFNLQNKVKELEVQNWIKQGQIRQYQQKCSMLVEEQGILKEKHQALEFLRVSKESEVNDLRREVDRLNLLLMQKLSENDDSETTRRYLFRGDE